MIDDIVGAIGETLGTVSARWKRLSRFQQVGNGFAILLVIFIIAAAIFNNLRH